MHECPTPFGKVFVDAIGGFSIVRDDLIAGGTKARVIPDVLRQIGAPHEVVYASPAYGYAQIALAHAAQAGGYQATVFVAKRKIWHPRTAEAARAGARIMEVPTGYLTNVTAKARAYAAENGALLLPFGIDLPEMRNALASIAAAMPAPVECWTVAGSGTLTRALQQAWPSTAFHAVRIGSAPDAGRASIYVAPEKFEQDARIPPPFPSCGNYDAKAWRFIQEHAQTGALFWNVAA